MRVSSHYNCTACEGLTGINNEDPSYQDYQLHVLYKQHLNSVLVPSP